MSSSVYWREINNQSHDAQLPIPCMDIVRSFIKMHVFFCSAVVLEFVFYTMILQNDIFSKEYDLLYSWWVGGHALPLVEPKQSFIGTRLCI